MGYTSTPGPKYRLLLCLHISDDGYSLEIYIKQIKIFVIILWKITYYIIILHSLYTLALSLETFNIRKDSRKLFDRNLLIELEQKYIKACKITEGSFWARKIMTAPTPFTVQTFACFCF